MPMIVTMVLVWSAGGTGADLQDPERIQELEEKIDRILGEVDDNDWRTSPLVPVRKIVALGRESLPILTRRIRGMPGRAAMVGDYEVLVAASFLLRPTDEEAVRVIQWFAFAPRTGGSEQAVRRASYWESAVLALLRIGGTAARSAIDKVAEKEDWEFQLKVVQASWLMLGKEDLEYAKEVFEGVVRDHPEWRISKTLRVAELPRIDLALGILQDKTARESVERLVRMIRSEEPYFKSVVGGRAHIWALKLLVETKPEGAAGWVRKALDDWLGMLTEKKLEPAAHAVKAYLEAIRALGGRLSEEEQEWLKQHQHTLPFPENLLTPKDLGLE